MENPIKMDDLGVYTIFGNIHMDMSILPKAPLHAVAVHNRLAEGIEGTACHSSPPASKRLTLLRTPGWVKVSWQKEGWENMDLLLWQTVEKLCFKCSQVLLVLSLVFSWFTVYRLFLLIYYIVKVLKGPLFWCKKGRLFPQVLDSVKRSFSTWKAWAWKRFHPQK